MEKLKMIFQRETAIVKMHLVTLCEEIFKISFLKNIKYFVVLFKRLTNAIRDRV